MALKAPAWVVNLVPDDQGHVPFGGPGVKLVVLIAGTVRTGLVLVTASCHSSGAHVQ